MKSRTKKIIGICVAVIAVASIASVSYMYYTNGGKQTIEIYAAGSLAVPFTKIIANFEKEYPNINVEPKFAGSVSLMRDIQSNSNCDVYASADWSTIPNLYNYNNVSYAKFDIGFALNQMALVFSNQTASQLGISSITNQSNWVQLLENPNAKVGFSDGNSDPCGYSALMVMALADQYYNLNESQSLFNNVVEDYSNITLVQNGTQSYVHLPTTAYLNPDSAKIMIAPKETDLLPKLESGAIQFLWIYKSNAIQDIPQGLSYITLPDQINMGSLNTSIIDNYYDNVHVYQGYGSSSQKLLDCSTMIYGVTIPTTSTHQKDAALFVKYLLESTGQKIMEEAGQTAIYPGIFDNSTLPYIPSTLSNDITASSITP